MRHQTDDDLYRAKLVYLGPPGYSLPFHLTYAQYGVFAAILAVLVLLGLLLFASWVILGPSIAIALGLTHGIFRYVDPDHPALKVIKTLLTDWRRLRTDDGQVPRLTASHITVRSTITESADGGDR